MLEDRNNTMIFLWEMHSIFMQISSIVLVLQHGRRAHTLYQHMPRRVGVITVPSSKKKPYSGITGCAVRLVVSKDGDPRFGKALSATVSIEPFFVTVGLQEGSRTNQRLPRVTTQ